MAGVRQSRTERRAGAGAVVINDRDVFILHTLAKLRYATTRQLTVLAFGSTSGTNKRLRRMLDSGLVRVWVRSLAQENTYALTVAGLKRLRDHMPIENLLPMPRRLDRKSVV